MKVFFGTGVAVAMLGMILSAPVMADTLEIPHNRGDKVIIHTYPDRYAHPVDYWWYQYGDLAVEDWDYFREVKHYDQPVKLNPLARLPDRWPVRVVQPGHAAVPRNDHAH